MSPSTTSATTIYNSTDVPLAIDRVGHMLGARERTEVEDVTASPLAGHIAAGRIVTIEPTRARKGAASTQEA